MWWNWLIYTRPLIGQNHKRDPVERKEDGWTKINQQHRKYIIFHLKKTKSLLSLNSETHKKRCSFHGYLVCQNSSTVFGYGRGRISPSTGRQSITAHTPLKNTLMHFGATLSLQPSKYACF